VPDVQYSWSLLAGGNAVQFAAGSIIPDPVYGPVIRLVNSPQVMSTLVQAAYRPSCYIVHLAVADQRDEDRSPTGGRQ
jgi:hypothetical protein